MMMRLNQSTLFCFDSLGKNNFFTQLPQSIQNQSSLIEYAQEVSITNEVSAVALNFKKLKLKDSQEKWFLIFCKRFCEINNILQVNILFNTKIYQSGESTLCGPWIIYFLHCLFSKNDYLFTEYIDPHIISAVLSEYFKDLQYNTLYNNSIYNLLPFFTFVKNELWSYLDTFAKNLFKEDFQLFQHQNQHEINMLHLTHEDKEEHYPQTDVLANKILKNNTVMEYLDSLDLVRVKESKDYFLSDGEITKIGDLLLANDIEQFKLEDRHSYFIYNYERFKNMAQNYYIPENERNETKEMEKLIYSYNI
nr:uncharacterized protein LOC124814263 [Hydra vulgaris]